MEKVVSFFVKRRVRMSKSEFFLFNLAFFTMAIFGLVCFVIGLYKHIQGERDHDTIFHRLFKKNQNTDL